MRTRTPPRSAAAAAAALLVVAATPAAALDDYAASFGGKQASSDQQKQQASAAAASASAYDAHTTRRERNLDHWDADTLAAYLGMDPEDGTPLPPASFSASDTADGSMTATSQSSRTDAYLGHDAAVLFYASWCPNCHALAPNWDAIATMLSAGTSKSNLIMALFDCERDVQHARLCGAAGVKHYPTILFAGSGEYHDTDPITKTVLGGDRSAGPAGMSTLRRTVKFQGDWRYGDQVLDWIKAMRALSSWHRLNSDGFLGVLRRGIFGMFRKGGGGGRGGSKGDGSLPVGIPPSFGATGAGVSSAGGGGAASSYALERTVKKMEDALALSERSKSDLEKAATHASYVIDSVLFPVAPPKEGGKCASADGTYIDPYAVLATNGGWDAKGIKPPTEKPATTADDAATSTDSAAASSSKDDIASTIDPYLLKTCVVDLTLDYCTRTSTKVTTDFLDELTANPDADYPSLFELDNVLKERVGDAEPYCALFDDCFAADFPPPTKEDGRKEGDGKKDDKKEVEGKKEGGEVLEKCRPDACPFENEVACRVVAGCFDERIRKEYEDALAELAAKKKEGGSQATAGDAAAAGAAASASATSGDQKAKAAGKGGGGGGGWGFAK